MTVTQVKVIVNCGRSLVLKMLHVMSSKVCRWGKMLRRRVWMWMDDNRKRKYIMTQRKCLERTGKQVAVQCKGQIKP